MLPVLPVPGLWVPAPPVLVVPVPVLVVPVPVLPVVLPWLPVAPPKPPPGPLLGPLWWAVRVVVMAGGGAVDGGDWAAWAAVWLSAG